jgi:hypothetical protein
VTEYNNRSYGRNGEVESLFKMFDAARDISICLRSTLERVNRHPKITRALREG